MQDIHPLKPSIQLVLPNEIIILLFIGISITVLIIWWIKRPKKAAKPVQKIPPKNLQKRMLSALDKLDQFIKAGDLDRFYLTLTSLLKKYIYKKYDQNIAELTTTEINNQLKLSNNTKKEIIHLLKLFDQAKFANIGQEAQTAKTILEQVKTDIKTGLI